jgi:hypothetical protein
MENKIWKSKHGGEIMEEESRMKNKEENTCRRNQWEELVENQSWRINHGGKITQEEIEEDKSPRGNHGGAMMEENS